MPIDDYSEAEALSVWKRRHVADDGDIGLIIEYFGPQQSCLIVVDDTTGDISSTIGVLGAEATDTTFLEPGGTGGNIDVSDANANTFGKVVDVINSIAYYRAYLVDVLRADASTVGMLLAMAASQAKVSGGLKLYKDTSVTLNLSLAVSGETLTRSDQGVKNEVKVILSNNTFASGTSKIQIYEGETKVAEWAGAATTVDQTISSSSLEEGVVGKKLLIRMIGQTYCTGYLSVVGRSVILAPTHKHKPD